MPTLATLPSPQPLLYRMRKSKAKRGGEYAVEGQNPNGAWKLQITTDDTAFAREWIQSRGGTLLEEINPCQP